MMKCPDCRKFSMKKTNTTTGYGGVKVEHYACKLCGHEETKRWKKAKI